jgi:ABC-type transport system involved in cytochrome bd biosynthesis fused ATPase/permease subunit
VRRRALEVGVACGLAGLIAAVMLSRGITGLQTTTVTSPVLWIVAALAVRAIASLAAEEFLAREQRGLRALWFGSVVSHLTHGGAGAVHDVNTAIDHIGEEPTVSTVTGTMYVAPVGLLIVFLVAGWIPTLIVVGLTALAIPAYARVGRQSAVVADEFQRRRRSIVIRQLDLLRSIVDLRALGAVSFGADEIAAESDAEHRAVMDGLRITIRSTLVSEFLGGVTVGLVAMDVGLGLWHHEISLMRALLAVLVTAEMGSWLRRYGSEFHRRDDAAQAHRILATTETSDTPKSTVLLSATDVTTDAPSGPASFHVAAGGRVAVTGASGVGKTLLLEAALGLRAARTGTTHRTDEPIALIRATNHFVDGTIFDNVTVGTTVDENTVRRTLADVGLDPSIVSREIRADGRAVSTGESVLVAIARGAIAGARLYVLDDVAASLDESTRERLARFFDRAPDLAVVEASHDVRVLARTDSEVHLVAT